MGFGKFFAREVGKAAGKKIKADTKGEHGAYKAHVSVIRSERKKKK